jgi:AbrB family looped-hinge helix DNA binding protein
MSSKTTTISKVGQRRQVVIPKSVLDELGLREGDFVEVTRTRNGALIKPKKLVDPDDFLSSEDVKSLRRGLAQARRGQTESWDKIKNELEH